MSQARMERAIREITTIVALLLKFVTPKDQSIKRPLETEIYPLVSGFMDDR
jgi:hypothetical protein